MNDELVVYELVLQSVDVEDLVFLDDLYTTAKKAAKAANRYLATYLGVQVSVMNILKSERLRSGARFDARGREVDHFGYVEITIRERKVH